MSKESVKSSRTRRQRGYAWEDTLVKRLRDNGWKAFRLGSPSIGLPDIIATKNDTIIAIEAKSGTTNRLKVEKDQIVRCLRWLDAFAIYPNRYAILAFKFSIKKWKGVDDYKRREKREYIKLLNNDIEPCNVICKYDGTIMNDKKQDIILHDYII
ncbi:MAG: hypothetical protein QW416_06775 [Candidatus Nitrosocaldaceae archaeon]